jgi:CspA family cold shock protein
MATGIVKKLVKDRGFGFIRSDDGKEYFFHTSGMTKGRFDDLLENDRVSFNPTEGPKGPRAEDVKVNQ